MIVSNFLKFVLVENEPCDIAGVTGLIFEADMLFHTNRHTMLHDALLAHRQVHELPRVLPTRGPISFPVVL
jgi:hypothetical protein